jgi:general secretion pathway protein K
VIEDEGGKIPVNLLLTGSTFNPKVKDLLSRLLTGTSFRMEQRKADDIIDAIKDWIDTDDDVTGGGAEGAYYAGLPRPYAAKNAPLDCIEELLMVKGISMELFYGTAESPGLVQCLTVFGEGEGRININTAPKPVLMALTDGLMAKEAALLEEYRRDERNNLSDATWPQRISGVTIPADLITFKSETFRITAIGLKERMTERITGVVKRDPNQRKVKLLAWKVD